MKLTLLFLAALSMPPGYSQGLTGIRKVLVSVQPLEPDLESSSLTTSSIQTDVELKFRQAGLIVTNKMDFEGVFEIVILSLKHKSIDVWSFCYRIEFREPVEISRSKEPRMLPTWRDYSVGYVGSGARSGIRDYIRDAADKFLNDWLKDNPPGRSR